MKKEQRRNTETETATGGGKNLHRCELKNFTGKRKTMQAFAWLYYGGLYWTRTSDPIDVNDVLYQLSQRTEHDPVPGNVYNNSISARVCQGLF